MFVEDLRQGRHRHLGNPADRLSAHAPGTAEPRAARLLARRQLLLVSLFRQPREISAGALASARSCGARRARHCDAGRGLGVDRRRSRRSAQPTPQKRGLGGFVRATWDEVDEIIAAANAYTIKTYGPDRVIGFSPIPAMSMVSLRGRRALSVADRRRLHVVLRLVLRPAAGHRRRPGASRPTCRKAPTGTIPASSSCGARTSRRPARPTRISTPRSATRAPRAS